MKTSRDRLIAVALFVLYANFFFFHELGSFGVGLFVAGLAGLAIGLFGSYSQWRRYPVQSMMAGVALSAVGISLFVGSPVRMGILYFTSLLTTVYGSYVLLREYHPQGLLEAFLSFPMTALEYVRSGLHILSDTINGTILKTAELLPDPARAKGSLRPLWTGALIGAPIAVILILMLVNADPIFASFVRHLVSEEFLRDLPGRLVLSAFLFVLLLPTIVMKMRRSYVSPLGFLTRADWVREMTVVAAMIAIVMGTFLIVQWPYVFVSVAKETSLSAFGVATYSEYVQKGFGELLKVALLVFGLSWVSLLIYRSYRTLSHSRWLLIMQGILGMEFVLFVASLFRRVFLYTQYHGLSLARLYGLALLIWIMGMAVTLALRYFRPVSYVRHEMGWLLGALFITAIINMESLVLGNPPTVNGRVDYVYLSGLSSDAYAGWKESYGWARAVLERENSSQGVIGADSRREIRYAEWILNNISYSYRHLVMKHGTPEEVAVAKQIYARPMSRFDQVLSYNVREAGVYRRIRNDITLEEIQRLRGIANSLTERISKQPEGERSIDYDISPNGMPLSR